MNLVTRTVVICLGLLMGAQVSVLTSQNLPAHYYSNRRKLAGAVVIAAAIDWAVRRENSAVSKLLQQLKTLPAVYKRDTLAKEIKAYAAGHGKQIAALLVAALVLAKYRIQVANWGRAQMPSVSGFNPLRLQTSLMRGEIRKHVERVLETPSIKTLCRRSPDLRSHRVENLLHEKFPISQQDPSVRDFQSKVSILFGAQFNTPEEKTEAQRQLGRAVLDCSASAAFCGIIALAEMNHPHLQRLVEVRSYKNLAPLNAAARYLAPDKLQLVFSANTIAKLIARMTKKPLNFLSAFFDPAYGYGPSGDPAYDILRILTERGSPLALQAMFPERAPGVTYPTDIVAALRSIEPPRSALDYKKKLLFEKLIANAAPDQIPALVPLPQAQAWLNECLGKDDYSTLCSPLAQPVITLALRAPIHYLVPLFPVPNMQAICTSNTIVMDVFKNSLLRALASNHNSDYARAIFTSDVIDVLVRKMQHERDYRAASNCASVLKTVIQQEGLLSAEDAESINGQITAFEQDTAKKSDFTIAAAFNYLFDRR